MLSALARICWVHDALRAVFSSRQSKGLCHLSVGKDGNVTLSACPDALKRPDGKWVPHKHCVAYIADWSIWQNEENCWRSYRKRGVIGMLVNIASDRSKPHVFLPPRTALQLRQGAVDLIIWPMLSKCGAGLAAYRPQEWQILLRMKLSLTPHWVGFLIAGWLSCSFLLRVHLRNHLAFTL